MENCQVFFAPNWFLYLYSGTLIFGLLGTLLKTFAVIKSSSSVSEAAKTEIKKLGESDV